MFVLVDGGFLSIFVVDKFKVVFMNINLDFCDFVIFYF